MTVNDVLVTKFSDMRTALAQLNGTDVDVLSVNVDANRNDLHVWATLQQMKELAWGNDQPLEINPFDERWDEASYKVGTAKVFWLMEKK